MAKEETGAMINSAKYNYDRVRTAGPDGKAKYSTGKNDAVSRAMLWIKPEGLRRLLKLNSLTDREMGDTNIGLYRMSVGNSLRAAVKRYVADPKNNQPVTIGEYIIKKLDQNVPIPAAPEKPTAVKKGEATTAKRAKAKATAGASKAGKSRSSTEKAGATT